MAETDYLEQHLERLERRDRIRNRIVAGLFVLVLVGGLWAADTISDLASTSRRREPLINYISEANERQVCEDRYENADTRALGEVFLFALRRDDPETPVPDELIDAYEQADEDLENLDKLCPPAEPPER